MCVSSIEDEPQSTSNKSHVLSLDSEAADETFETLTASMTRMVLSIIYEQPSTPTEIRDEIDISLRTVHDHLEKLEAAGFIEPIGVEYSENGIGMTLYAPANEAIVLVAGQEFTYHRLKEFFG